MAELNGAAARRFRGENGTNGTNGTNGNSITVIYQKASSTPSTPTGGTWNLSDYDPPSGWHESIPGAGTDPVYISIVILSGTTQGTAGITYSMPVRLEGEDGVKGNSVYSIWKASVSPITTAPNFNTGPNAITMNDSGDIVVRDDWHIFPPVLSGAEVLYRQNFEANFGTSPPTLTALGVPMRDGRGSPGSRGVAGPAWK